MTMVDGWMDGSERKSKMSQNKPEEKDRLFFANCTMKMIHDQTGLELSMLPKVERKKQMPYPKERDYSSEFSP
jgi:hypothetical protein